MLSSILLNILAIVSFENLPDIPGMRIENFPKNSAGNPLTILAILLFAVQASIRPEIPAEI